MEWFIHDGERKIGPITGDALRAMAATGKIEPDTLIWRRGMESWTKASLVPGVLAPPLVSSIATAAERDPASPKSGSGPTAGVVPGSESSTDEGRSSGDEEHEQASYSEFPTQLATPWRRYWARFLDLTIFSILLTFALAIIMPSLFAEGGRFYGPGGDQLFGWLVLPFAMVAEGIVLGLFGATPGKAIAGVQVSGVRGAKLKVGDAIQRNFQVWWYGLGTGFPIISLFTLVRAHSKASRGELLKWEASTGGRSYAKGSGIRTIVTALICVAIYAGLIAAGTSSNTLGQSSFSAGSDQNPKWVENDLQTAATEINQEAPILIDEYTRLDGATAGPGQVLTYRYTLIETDVEQIVESALRDFENDMGEAIRLSTCDDPDTRSLLNAGVRFVYRYDDAAGNLVTQLEVKGRDCSPF